MTVSPNGTLFVASYSFVGISGDTKSYTYVYAVRDNDNDGVADFIHPVTELLWVPNGIVFHDGDLYVALIDRVLRYPDVERNLTDPVKPVTIIPPGILPNHTWHGWRYLRAGRDNRLYLAIGAPCNVPCNDDCECIDYEKHPLYGGIVSFNTDGSDLQKIARGVRNSVGMDWHPDTGELWFTDNGRDNWNPGHDNRPPDELNRITNMTLPGQHFGFPYCYGTDMVDPNFNTWGNCDNMTGAVVELGVHVAALGMRFYTGDMFPLTYQNTAFIAEHGSWNRQPPNGYRVSTAFLNAEGTAGAYEPFMSGFINNARTCTTDADCPGTSSCQNSGAMYRPPYYCSGWGRPADVQVWRDGSLLVSDEQNGVVYRITYDMPWYRTMGFIVATPIIGGILLTFFIA